MLITLRKLALYAAASLLLCGAAHAATPSTVWRIGTFNDSSGEFRSQDIDYASPASDPVYRVGSSTVKDWLRFQPGPANGLAGGRLHPFTVLFDLKNHPRGVYSLKLAMLYETPRLSYLKLDINGHTGLFYFHPKLDFAAGDWEGTFVPQTSADTKVIEIPASWLKQGENRLVLTALDDPPAVEHSLGAIAPGDSGLVYDALELDHDPVAKYDNARVTALIQPTIFYRTAAQGLTEQVDVFASFARLPSRAVATLRIAGHTFTQQISPSQSFGEQKFSFEVPEWQGTVPARFNVHGRTIDASLTAAKKWTMLIVPFEHLDIGFTDYPEKVSELQSASIDSAMDVMRKVPGFRWTLDGSWLATQYLAGRSKSAGDRFLQHVRDGKVVITPEFANQHTGNASLEGLIRSLYGEHQLALKYHLPQPNAAQIVDVPSYTWSYASVLHDSGIKYFVAASNSWRAPIMLLGRWNEKSPFYWEGPDGGRVLMWYSRAYLQMHTLFGSPWHIAAGRDSLPVFLQAYTRPDYKANSAIIFGSQLENTPFDNGQAELPQAWNSHYAFPHLEFATVQSAMQRIDKEADGKFPVYRGDFGPYWEDGYGSDAFYTAIHRHNQERILTAEKMGTIPSVLSPILRPDESLLQQAWNNQLLYDEHTWDYVGATTQPESQQATGQLALKRAHTTAARREITESIQRSWGQLESFLSPRESSLAVFNSLNWKRSGLITIDLPIGSGIVDSVTGKPVPFEVLKVEKGIQLPGFGPGSQRVRFEASDIPAMGYKLFTLKTGVKSDTPELPPSNQRVIENSYYRVTLDPATGSVENIFDKQLNRELVDPNSPYRFGQYLYVTGGDSYPDNSLYRYGAGIKPAHLTIHPATAGKLVSVRRTPFGTVIVLDSSSVNTPRIRTTITLFNSEKKIEFRYDLHKTRVLSRESAYIAFPFLVAHPNFVYGDQTGWVDPAKDELAGGSREWYLVTHFAAVTGANVAATITPLDAPLVNFGDIMRGKWPSQFKPATSTIFSWLMNNYWGTNFPAWQGGNFTFRYVLTSSATLDPSAANRFGLDAMTPLESDAVAASYAPSTLPSTEASFVHIDNPDVVLTTWKRAEDGDGTILRLQETGGVSARVELHSAFLKFTRGWLCSSLEDRQSELTASDGNIEVSLKPFQVVTLRVETVSNLPAVSGTEEKP